MKARLYLSPLDAPIAVREITALTRLEDLLPEEVEVREWFADGGVVRLNGHLIPPDRWHRVTIKPAAAGSLDLVYVPSGKKTFALLATVAVLALTAGIGAFGIPFLGAGFAAGTLGANLVAAGVGLAGSLLVGALTAPPKAANQGEDRPLAQAGVAGNVATVLEPLPVVFGKIGVSPPLLAPPYTTWDGDNLTAYAAVGLQGRCLIENIKVNGLPISDIAGVAYEYREGRIGDAARTMFTQTVIEERDGITLSNFQTELESDTNDLLVDQTTPDNSAPQWHYFRTAGEFSSVVLRFLFPSGIVYTPDAVEAVVPVRIEMRKVGDVSWRKLPTFHFADYRAGSGPMRAEIRIERRNPVGGINWSTAIDELPVCNVTNITNIGDTPYESDAYFQEDNVFGTTGIRAIQRALFTSATNSEGYTISASSTNGTDSPWKSSSATDLFTPYWRPTDGTLGAGCYLQWDCPAPTTFRSYFLSGGSSGVQNYTATKWRVLGSNDNWATSTQLDDTDIDISKKPTHLGDYQIGNPGAYSSYRWVFLGVVSGTQLRVARLNPNTGDAVGCVFNDPQGAAAGTLSFHSSSYNKAACKYATLDKRGARVFLKPGDWSEGEYEIRVKRGIAVYEPFFTPYYALGANLKPYSYNGNTGTASHYFDYFSSSGYKIYIGQKVYRSDCTIEAFQTISDESPFDDTGIAMIAVAAPNAQISSVFAEFTRYAAEWNGTIWDAIEVPTQNPAALYRQLLLGGANAKPVNGESMPEDELADWFETCDANGYECNAVMQGARVGEAKQMIATAGYASPRDAETYGIVEDKDTTAEPVRDLISPINSRHEGDTQELADLPDAIRAEFNDASQSYALEHTIVYREGVDASTARIFETISYPGFTDQTKVEARAAFDLKQAHMRQVRYARRVGLDGALLRRGSLVGISDDTIDGKKAAGWITAVTVDGSDNVTAITLDNIMPWSASDSIEDVEDFESIADLLDPSVPMGVAIRIPGGNVLMKQVSDVSDSNVCTFSTPFALAGSGLEDMLDVDGNVTGGGYMVVAGEWGNIYRRCKVISVVPQGFEERLIVAVDEAPGLYT